MRDLSLDRATFGPLGFGAAVLGNLYAPVSDGPLPAGALQFPLARVS